jgi:hypothetical protein
MKPIQINLLFDDEVVEFWKYFPEEDAWRDEIAAMAISTRELIDQDLPAAIEHFLPIIKGTHG